jgi:hypothetical protein
MPARQGGAERSASRHHRAARSSSQSSAQAQSCWPGPRLMASGKRSAGSYFRLPLSAEKVAPPEGKGVNERRGASREADLAIVDLVCPGPPDRARDGTRTR